MIPDCWPAPHDLRLPSPTAPPAGARLIEYAGASEGIVFAVVSPVGSTDPFAAELAIALGRPPWPSS